MPRLACWVCGRQIQTVSPMGALFPEERRCPRCGSFLDPERRGDDRRQEVRRQGSSDDPGAPGGAERRVGDRRGVQRRVGPTGQGGGGGWRG